MTAHPETVAALADTFTRDQLRDYRTTALKVQLEGGTVTRNYEGSSFTISRENCQQIITDCNAALKSLDAMEAGDDPDLTREAAGVGIDFRHRRVE